MINLTRLFTRLMTVWFVSVATGCFCPTSHASEPPPPASTRSAPTSGDQSDQWKIVNALTAAPDFIADNATVMDWPAQAGEHQQGRILRKGNNGWTCMPDRPGKPAHDPMCADDTMMEWIKATLAGRQPNIDRVGIAYMLQGEAGADQNDLSVKTPPEGQDWYYVGPHVMVVLPDANKEALKYVNEDISTSEPYVTALPSSSPLLVIPIARPKETLRIKKLESQ